MSGCASVSITNSVQKNAMERFRWRREYGSGGGPSVVSTVVSAVVSMGSAIGTGDRNNVQRWYCGAMSLLNVCWFSAFIQ